LRGAAQLLGFETDIVWSREMADIEHLPADGLANLAYEAGAHESRFS
jgi:hypothetical protein